MAWARPMSGGRQMELLNCVRCGKVFARIWNIFVLIVRLRRIGFSKKSGPLWRRTQALPSRKLPTSVIYSRKKSMTSSKKGGLRDATLLQVLPAGSVQAAAATSPPAHCAISARKPCRRSCRQTNVQQWDLHLTRRKTRGKFTFHAGENAGALKSSFFWSINRVKAFIGV